ncbi:response regulator transcription factor [Streptomyces sp. CT34]|uniref:response regulator n=1 Tax=Streptomyces sp. CT34 TaxID=1553907 RepID=UPI0005BE1FED|nr:response regulator transcription factor [Streptomyces sp. CT34]
MIQVVIADDEDLVRSGIRVILEAADGIGVVGEARDGMEAVSLCEQLRPDVALLDAHMPGCDGFAATRRLMAEQDPPRIIILTAFGMAENLFQAMEAGASGFLLKHLNPAQLVQAVFAAAVGNTVLSSDIAKKVLTRSIVGRGMPSENSRNALSKFGRREREVLALLGQGMSNLSISKELHVSESSVKTYVSRILTKLQLENRTQAALLAVELGLSNGSN